jgi:GTP pyrophosphokinase
MEIFAPIAHRLGMGKLRGELEDLAFRHMHPDDYRELAEQLEKRRPENESFLKNVTARIEEKMNEAEVPFVLVEGRVKRLYSIWKKLRRQRISLDQVYDLVALESSLKRNPALLLPWCCYNNWKPVQENQRLDSNTARQSYQSLHTSVGSNVQSFEVQIRTGKCITLPKKASRPIGNTRRASAALTMTIRPCRPCARR